MKIQVDQPALSSQVKNMALLAKLMDSQFRIPGTNIRIGLDALMGLLPGIGDFATFAVSGYMLLVLGKNGASGYVLSRMVMNIVIDAVIGSIPILGDLFDIAFKANERNLHLMREHYVEGRHKGGAWRIVAPVLILLFFLIAGIIWVGYKLLDWIF